MAYSTFDVRYPQWLVEIDPSKCKRSRTHPRPSQVCYYPLGLRRAVRVQLQRFSKVYKVMIQSDRNTASTKLRQNTFVRMSNGEMAPRPVRD